MSRLPQPGADKGTWGDILNDFLSQSHNTDGSLKQTVLDNRIDAKIAAQAAADAGLYVLRNSLAINVQDYGAKGDGTTDDTAAIQSALNAVPSKGALVFFPAGVYSVPNGGLTCAKPVHIIGVPGLDGTGSRISVTADAVTALSLSGSASVVEHLNIRHILTGPRSANLVGLALSNANFSRLDNVRIEGFGTNAAVSTGIYYSIINCNFRDFVNVGLDYSNELANGDAGDGTIQNCTFDRGSDTVVGGTAVLWHSGGGMRFENNKINGKASGGSYFQHGLQLNPSAAAQTGVIIVVGNSIENFTGYGFSLLQGSSTFYNTVIVGNNEINGTSGASGSTGILLNNSPSGVSITGNHLYSLDVGIDLNRIEHATVDGNSLTNIITTGLYVRQYCRDVVLGRQTVDMQTGGTDVIWEKPGAMGEPVYEKAVPFGGSNGSNMPNITDGSVYNFFEIAVSSYNTVVIDINTTGIASGAGAWASREVRLVAGNASGSDLSVATIGSDYAFQGTCAGIVVTATGLAGVVRIGVQKLSGTALTGLLHIRVRGCGLLSFKQLQRYN